VLCEEPPSSDFFLKVIDLVAHPIFAKDRDYRYVLVNRAAAEVIGWPREEILGKTDAEVFPALEAARRRRDDEQTLAGGVSVELPEQLLTTLQGQVRVMATTKTPLFDQSGQASHLVGVAHDITHLKRLEVSLRQSNEELEARVRQRTAELQRTQHQLLVEERNAVLGQVATGLAHQLRNSLAVILNASSILAREKTLEQDAAQAIEAIRQEVYESSTTVGDLLSHTRVASPTLLPVSVATIVSATLDGLSIPDDVAVRVKLDPDLQLLADPHQLVSVLGNLIRNAIEAMPEGGDVYVSAREMADVVAIFVRDTGSGIAPCDVPFIFQPLISTKPLGLGLGLSASKLLVEAQKGEISYIGSDTGAEFEIRLPKYINSPADQARRVR
jgi:PAS domain S-box-containing protein